ncbi:MAG TPA: hypothetical protein VFN21_12050 [Acidimicrobiales bacterium]|nr:hypothetical protein [Acidimicrobiales bacterium]
MASTTQLLAAGFSQDQIAALERRRAIVRVHDGVFRTAATVLTPRRRLLAACLAIGGVVAASDRAALWLWDLHDDEPPVEVATSGLSRPAPEGVAVHIRRDLEACQVSVRRGVPVTSPARTLTDVGTVVDRETLACAVDKALYLRLVSLQQLRGVVGSSAGTADAGIEALGAVLGHRVHGF